MDKYFVLVDGSSYLYRAFHAMPALNNSKGQPTGAIYGMINMLRKLLADYKPDNVAVVFDAKGKTFRDDLFPAYKATRTPMPSELVQQIQPIHDIIVAMGLPILMIDGVEADDVIGTLAQEATEKGQKTLISTGDKDLAQLVNEHITLINTMNNTLLTPETVLTKFGIPPHLIVDYLALVGDSVDNIPGVPNVGPKTAVKWLNQFGSLENIMQRADEISGKVGENLRHSLAQLPLAKQLASIKLDVELPQKISDLSHQPPNAEKLTALYKEFEFKTWYAESLKANPEVIVASTPNTEYEVITNQTQLKKTLESFGSLTQCVIKVITDVDTYMTGQVIGLALAIQAGKVFYFPCGQDIKNAEPHLDKATVMDELKPLLENPQIKKIGHDLKFAAEIFNMEGINLQGITFDTMLASYILDSASNNHTTHALALRYLGWSPINIIDIAGKGAKKIPFEMIPFADAAKFIHQETDATWQLYETLAKKIAQAPGLEHIFTEIEIPLLSVLAHIEQNGVLIDPAKLAIQSREITQRLVELEGQCFQEAGQTFNIGSPKQLQEILFNQLKLPVLQKTPTGQPSTADPILQELALDYVLPKLIIEYRSLSKLLSTYINRLPEQINATTQRIHTSYNQTGAATGRLSSSDPNLQNIPIKTAEGRRIRQAFVAPAGYKIVSADYSQIELRIMSHISSDPSLLKAFANNLDIHQATAAEVLGIPLAEVTSEQRRSAKAINFGLMYGMSSFGLGRQLGLSRHMAQEYIDRYFARYPRVKKYMEDTRAQAHENGYVETLSGRRLYLPEINSSQMMRRKAAERAAINAPLQGTAADIVKRAMISLHHALAAENYPVKMIMQVHDELVFEVADSAVDAAVEFIRQHMVQAGELAVPLLVSVGVGDNWDAASAH